MSASPRFMTAHHNSTCSLARGPVGVPLRAPCHPGELLRRLILEPLGLTQSDTARLLGVSRRRLHEIIQGQRSMTPDTAIRCALVFETDAAYWLTLQAAWDNYHAWKSMREQNQQTPLLRATRLRSRVTSPSAALGL